MTRMKCIYIFNNEYCSIVHIFETMKPNDKKQKDCEIQLQLENIHSGYAQQKKESNYQNLFVFNGSFI